MPRTIKEHETIKGHCPSCGGSRNAKILRQFHDSFNNEDQGVWGEEHHYILRCAGCDSIFHRKDELFSEDYGDDGRPEVRTTYWPSPSRQQRPHWLDFELDLVDSTLYELTNDVYTALDVDLPVMAAIGMRTAFDRASKILKIGPGLPFGEKLDALVQIGKIGPTERENLNVLTEAGNAAAHRGWKPSPTEVKVLVSILEQFLYRAFVIDKEVKLLKRKIPGRARRKARRVV